MRRIIKVIACAILVDMGSTPALRAAEDEGTSGFKSIFNGRNLAGWTVDSDNRNGWRVEGGRSWPSGKKVAIATSS